MVRLAPAVCLLGMLGCAPRDPSAPVPPTPQWFCVEDPFAGDCETRGFRRQLEGQVIIRANTRGRAVYLDIGFDREDWLLSYDLAGPLASLRYEHVVVRGHACNLERSRFASRHFLVETVRE